MTVYLVTSRRAYRCHEPGEMFEATLRRGVEMRAIEGGRIQVIEETVPTVPAGHTFPSGWADKREGGE